MCLAIDALAAWLASNRLLLDASKNQFIWLGGDRHLVGPLSPLLFEKFQDSVRDLGVILDRDVSFSLHINQLTRSCYYQLLQLRGVSRSLSCSAAVALVHSFVTSRLDHCSSILVGLPLALTARLDRVLRCAARLIGCIPKYAFVSIYMRDTLHWLPVAQRISYGVAVLVWRFLLSSASAYLCELCAHRYLVYLDGEPFVLLLLASYWCLVLKLQLGSVAHSPLLVPPPGMDSPWKSVSCLKIMKVRFAGCLRLICIAMVGLEAPPSRFIKGAPYKFLNE